MTFEKLTAEDNRLVLSGLRALWGAVMHLKKLIYLRHE